jgi:hypothetical protein
MRASGILASVCIAACMGAIVLSADWVRALALVPLLVLALVMAIRPWA